jgi:hypothetical protein
VLSVKDCWDYGSTVGYFPRNAIGSKMEKRLEEAHRAGMGFLPLPLVRKPDFAWKVKGANRMDFARGITETAEAAQQRRDSRLSAEWNLHICEIALRLAAPGPQGSVELSTRCEVPAPMPWAQ